MSDSHGPSGERATDPVLVRRARVKSLVDLGQRLGYGLFGLAVVAFAVGLSVGFGGWPGTVVIVALLAGSLVLAPSIVFGYAVRAAERADREGTW